MTAPDYETTVGWLMDNRESSDYKRLRIGVRIARMEKRYGSAVVPKLATDSGFGRSTLYEYQAVFLFVFRWLGFSAVRIFDNYPHITHSHLRQVIRKGIQHEIGVLMLRAIADGDENYPEFDDSLPMSPEAFGVYVSKRLGKDVPPSELFRFEGRGIEAHTQYMARHFGWEKKRVRIVVNEIDSQ